jgi:hypothetical protein
MQPPTHQTVRLSKGRHSSPAHGACVMELASMLAGESFTDHPRSVSPVIATFLRSYNDIVDDERRQDLYRYAAEVVGTAGDEHAEHVRAERLIDWADAMEAARSRWSPFVRLRRRSAHATRRKGAAEAARYAIRVMPKISDRSHARVLGLLDDLIAVESPGAQTPTAQTPRVVATVPLP